MTENKYQEAAKEYAHWHNLKIPGEADGQAAIRIFLAGASFAEKEKQTEIDELEAMMQHVKSVEKEAHNAAIDKALTTMKIEWREDRQEIYNAIQKLKI